MKFFSIVAVVLALSFRLWSGFLTLEGVDFHYRLPRNLTRHTRVMVLVGGRNWSGDKTLKAYNFAALADRHSVLLISPSFRDRNYWEPEAWSGRLLKRAIGILENRFKITPGKVYLYGYSAGGQCAALFSQWMPERVAAWGVHACGVFPEKITQRSGSALVTCGTEDRERFQISRDFVYRCRETGNGVVWKYFPDCGHELRPAALDIAKVWFDDLLAGRKVLCSAEDDTGKVDGDVDIEFRNPLRSEKMKELWLGK